MSNDVSKAILREIGQINRKSVFDDNATIEPEEDNCMVLKVTLTPQTGLFANTCIPFVFEISGDYPASPPVPYCKKVIYHSNISEDGSVCLNMFSEPDPSYRIEQYVNGLLWLLDNQNFDSQLNGYVTPNRSLFKVNFKLACMGYPVGGLSPSDIYVKKPGQIEKRKLMRELIDFNGAFPGREARKPRPKAKKKEGEEPKGDKQREEAPRPQEKQPAPEVQATAFLSALSSKEPGHRDFLVDQLPFLAHANRPALSFLWQRGTTTRASALISRLHLKAESLVRPVVIKRGDQLALLMLSGSEDVDAKALSTVFGEPVEIPKASQLKEIDGELINQLPLGFSKGQVFVDEDLTTAPSPLFVQTQFPNLILKGEAADILSFFSSVWPTLQRVKIPRDPPRTEKVAPAAMAPTSSEEEEERVGVDGGAEEIAAAAGAGAPEEEREERRPADEKEDRERKEEKKERERERERITCRTASASEEPIEVLPVVSGV